MNEDVEWLRRIASDMDQEALALLITKHAPLLQEEIDAVFQKADAAKNPVDEEAASEAALTEVLELIFDNVRDYRESHGTVATWLRTCARVASVYWLNRAGRWRAHEDPSAWLISKFWVHYKKYPDDVLLQISDECPLKRAAKHPPIFDNGEPGAPPGCNGPCVILVSARNRSTPTQTARLIRIKEGTINHYLKQCRQRADHLVFNREHA